MRINRTLKIDVWGVARVGRLHCHVGKDRSKSGSLEPGLYPLLGLGCNAEGREQGVLTVEEPGEQCVESSSPEETLSTRWTAG